MSKLREILRSSRRKVGQLEPLSLRLDRRVSAQGTAKSRPSPRGGGTTDVLALQRAFAVIDDYHVAFLEAGAEGGDGAVFPDIHEDRLAGEDGGREAHVEA